MESSSRSNNIKITFVAASCVAAVSLYFILKQWREKSKCSCYLHSQTKPQYSFKRLLADNSYSHFNHLTFNASNPGELSHPFEKEIKALVENPQIDLNLFHELQNLQLPASYNWVETELQLERLVGLLSNEKVIAVDTEQHSLHSFRGFTALIQISTGKEDYLVDTIALHDFMSILRPVFADSSICKVFHGADNDVLWLQRDFHIYVVNLFDTAKACEVLSKPQKSLAYLLETYCGVVTNKLLQREDWRQRPLSEEMVQYAQMDAHYLLHIAGCLTGELIEKGNASQDENSRFLLEVSRRSNSTCLQLYMKEDEEYPGESAALSILSRHLPDLVNTSIDWAKFQDAVKKLCAWRDLMARIHDESSKFVLSDQAIVALANKIPFKEAEVVEIIYDTEQNVDPSSSLSSVSPSPVIMSHWEDLLLIGSSSNDEDMLLTIIRRHLGANGTCPLSIQNYGILSKFNLKVTSRTALKQNGTKHAKYDGERRKSSRESFVRKFSCKSPVYHNCRIYASDGRLLCYCDKRKLEWYVQRNLAELVDENPPAIILLFEPKGRPEDEDNDFYIQSKKNICVGCGENNHYLRYRIIPSCYRTHFPEHLKSHRSHDIVLLCVDCHEVAHAAAEKYKREVADEFKIPLFVRKVADSGQLQSKSDAASVDTVNEGVSPLHLRTAAMALLLHGPRMPIERQEELIEIVKKYYGGRDISQEDLEKAMLVGMSPHEQRKFEKKRGMSCKQAAANILQDIQQKGSAHSFNRLNTHESHSSNGQELSEPENSGMVLQTDKDAADKISPNLGSVAKEKDISVNGEDLHEVKDVSEDNVDRSSSNDTVETYPKSEGTTSAGHGSKGSLLGHGPHGKKVVDYLLDKYGEDGIHQFCQRWRLVFTDSLNPKYLPPGWDIMHSGKRDFGDFSVYNPSKRPSIIQTDAS